MTTENTGKPFADGFKIFLKKVDTNPNESMEVNVTISITHENVNPVAWDMNLSRSTQMGLIRTIIKTKAARKNPVIPGIILYIFFNPPSRNSSAIIRYCLNQYNKRTKRFYIISLARGNRRKIAVNENVTTIAKMDTQPNFTSGPAWILANIYWKNTRIGTWKR